MKLTVILFLYKGSKLCIARDECEMEYLCIYKQLYLVKFEKEDERIIKICNRIKNQVIQYKVLIVEANTLERSMDPALSEKVRIFLRDKIVNLKNTRNKINKLTQYSNSKEEIELFIDEEIKDIEEDFKPLSLETISYNDISLLFERCNDVAMNAPGNGAPLDENFTLELFLYTRRYGKILRILRNFIMPPFKSLHVTSISQGNEDLKFFSENCIKHQLDSLCFNAFNKKSVQVSEYLPALKLVKNDVYIGWFDVQSKDIETIINECVSKKKLSFERCNFIIDKDIIFDSKYESTLTEIILTDIKFTEESFEIFAKAIRESSISKSLTSFKVYRLGIPKESITKAMSIIDQII